MNRYQEMVRDFHQVMGCEYGWPTRELRISLIEEEAKEMADAVQAEDPIEILDGLCDLLYVLYGAADILDIDIGEIRYENEEASVPADGFLLMKGRIVELDLSLLLLSRCIRGKDKRRTTHCLRDLIQGCWVTAKVGLGMDLEPFFNEVHRTNMLKLTGPRRADGKVLKPEGWQPPRIADMYAKRKGMPVPEDTP